MLSRQIAVTLLSAAVAGAMLGMDAAISAALGGAIGVAGGYVYAWRAMRGLSSANFDARKAFHAQVLGEGYKFAITLVLFVLVFKGYEGVAALPLFVAFAATIVVYWIALLRQR